MASFIQSLESRVFLSATSVTTALLNADKATVAADATTLNADVKTLFGADKVQSKLVATAFKALPKADQVFLKALDLDESKGGSSLTKDIAALVKTSSALAKKSAATGVTLLTRPTIALVNLEQNDIASLNTITNAPLINLQALFSSTKLKEERDAIVAAFPAETVLVDAIIAEETNSANGKATILGEAVQYQADIAKLSSDLSSVVASVGTLPNLVGTFSGIAATKTGQTAAITLTFVTQDAAGKVTGTVTDLSTGGVDNIKGTLALNGKLTLVASGSSRGTITGQVAFPSISGKFAIGKIAGTFTASEATT